MVQITQECMQKNKVKKCMLKSTDKAVNQQIYGSTKKIKIFTASNSLSAGKTKLSIVSMEMFWF